MTDNEIIKALECHKERELATCQNCPLLNIDGCAYELSEYVLSLINRQQAEIEVLSQKRANIFEISSAYERGRIAGVKEFADRLRKRVSGVGVHNAIDCVEMEMVGEDK